MNKVRDPQLFRAERIRITSTVMKLYFITDRDFMHAYAHRLLQASGLTHDEIYHYMRGMSIMSTSHISRMYVRWMLAIASTGNNPYVLTPEQCNEWKPMFEKVFTARTEEEVLAVLVTDPHFKEEAFPAMTKVLIDKLEAATVGTKNELRFICDSVGVELAKESTPWHAYFPKKYTADELFAIFDKPHEIDFDTRYLEIVKFIDTMKQMMQFVTEGMATLDNRGLTMKKI